jgi:LytTr DNA-binding domain
MHESHGKLRQMPEKTTRASPNAAANSGEAVPRNLVPQRTGYAVAAGGAILLAITGAFNTGEAPLALRLGYWLVVMLSGALIGSAVTAAVHGWGKLAGHAVAEGAVIAVCIALPLTLLVSGASMLAFGLRGFTLIGVAYMFVLVLFVSIIMVAINYLLAAQRRAGMAEAGALAPVTPSIVTPVAPPRDDRFRERLPLGLRSARLIAVASEDHYLRVYTDAGEAMILLRLADALAELAAVPGAQTHRSWWVARDAVTRVERGAGKATLHLTGGNLAPVSRSFLPVLAQQGWR